MECQLRLRTSTDETKLKFTPLVFYRAFIFRKCPDYLCKVFLHQRNGFQDFHEGFHDSHPFLAGDDRQTVSATTPR